MFFRRKIRSLFLFISINVLNLAHAGWQWVLYVDGEPIRIDDLRPKVSSNPDKAKAEQDAKKAK